MIITIDLFCQICDAIVDFESGNIDAFDELGFYKFNSYSSGLYFFRHDKLKLIVKKCYVYKDNPPDNRYFIPTIPLSEIDRHGHKWVIQPMAETDYESRIIASEFFVQYKPNICREFDIKESNCGFYNDKPVAFDW